MLSTHEGSRRMFIARSFPSVASPWAQNEACLSLESIGAWKSTRPGTAVSISWVAVPPALGRCAHTIVSVITTTRRSVDRAPVSRAPF